MCKEHWEAVVIEAPSMGLLLTGRGGDPLVFAKSYYDDAFKKNHGQHTVKVEAFYTKEPRHDPWMVAYYPEISN